MIRKKVVLLGEIGVGKTSLIRRFVLDRFETSYKGTIGFNIYTSSVLGVGHDGKTNLELLIWDTDGDEAARLLQRTPVIQGTSGVLIVADLSRPRTIHTMLSLARACDMHIPGRHIHLLLNKADLVEAASPTPPELAEIVHPVMFTSAKTGDKVRDAFRDVADTILRRGL